MLIYIGTPMAAAGLWKRQDIDRFEAAIYRKILGVANNIPNKAILNKMTSIRLAGEAITSPSRKHGSSLRNRTESLTTSRGRMASTKVMEEQRGQIKSNLLSLNERRNYTFLE